MNAPDTLVTRFPVLRSVVREDLATLDDHALASVIEESLPGVSADELEINFGRIGRSIGRGLGKAGNVLGRAAPGALTGAMQGATMGAALGPYGMLAGAALGAVGGGVASYQQSRQPRQPAQGTHPQTAPTGRPQPQSQPQPQPQSQPSPQRRAPQQPPSRAPAGRPMTAINAPAGVVPRAGPAPAATLGQSAAANQILQLLARPEILQALLSLAMGAAGRRRIRVGEHIVAPVQMLNAVELVASGMPLETGPTGSVETDPFDAIGVSQAILAELSRTDPGSSEFYRAVELTAGREHSDGEEEETYPDWNPRTDDAWPPDTSSGQFEMEDA